MWDSAFPILTEWPNGRLRPAEVLYEVEGPTIFTSKIGLLTLLFYKADEVEDTDIFLACEVKDDEIVMLKRGDISVRAALSYRRIWLVQTTLSLEVQRFQERSFDSVQNLLPPAGVSLIAGRNNVPDSIEQATALLAFKFVGPAMSSDQISLDTFKGYVDQLANLVRQALLPAALTTGRNSRFFDVHIGQPLFASLILSIKEPAIDESGLRNYEPTSELSARDLLEEVSRKGQYLWNSIEATAAAAQIGEIDPRLYSEYGAILQSIINLVPNSYNELERLDVTYREDETPKTVSITRAIGDRLLRASSSDLPVRVIAGSVIEVNGDSRTFVVKDAGARQTTCAPTYSIFEALDATGALKLGHKLRITGRFTKRKRRDYLSVDQMPEILPN